MLIDYVNRFWLMDVDARMQLFDLKTKYQFMTSPGVDQYNMPLYDIQIQPGAQSIASFPVYQGFTGPALVNGVPVSFETQRQNFFGVWFNYIQNFQGSVQGNGTSGPYTINFPILPNFPLPNPPNPPFSAILRGHVDIAGIIATGNNIDPPIGTTINTSIPSTSIIPAVYITTIDATGQNVIVSDSGQFLTGNVNYGLLMTPGNAPYGNAPLPGAYTTTSNTVNYLTGVANVTFPVAIPAGQNITCQCQFFQTGLPRSILYYNNVITLRSPPALQYLVELDAYLTPAAFLNTGSAIPFGYMSEYIARGAARKILSDTGDVEQFEFYEQFFREQEMLVWKRSQRQFTANRTQTLYSQGYGMGYGLGVGNLGGSI
ncbi:MAG: hypothetical protein ABI554_02280 [Flavobacterium sp.]